MEYNIIKINKNDFSIMNQVKLSTKGGGNSRLWGDLNIMALPDGGFVISRFINNVGYILKGPSDLNIDNNNCVFNVANPITDYNLVEKNISTFVGCLSPAPNILNNRNGENNQELDNLTGGSRRR
jgi:hypothetical protein